jgi:hypothetical protein
MPGTPLYPKDMATEWMNLKKQVKGAFTSGNSKTAFAKIGAGAVSIFTSLVVEAGAFVQTKYENGESGFYFGHLLVGGLPAEGIIMRRPDASLLFSSYAEIDTGNGFTAIYDKSGNIIISDDSVSEVGLARPWIPLTFADTTEIATPPAGRQTSGTTDVVVVSTLTAVQHPVLRMNAYVYVAVGGSTCNYKVKDVGTGATLLSGTTTGGYVQDEFAIPGDFSENHQIDVTIRRASGSGAVGITVLSLMGKQS